MDEVKPLIFRPDFKQAFIFEPEVASEFTLAHLNQMRSGERVFLPSEEAIGKARKTKGNNKTKLIALASHPDERVPLALLENPDFDIDKIVWKLVVVAIGWAAHKRASRDGVLWNRVFDALAQKSSDVWSNHWWRKFQEKGLKAGMKVRYNKYTGGVSTRNLPDESDPWILELNLEECKVPFWLYHERTKKIKEWLESQQPTDTELGQLLTGFKAEKLHKVIGQTANWTWNEEAANKWMPGRTGLILGVLSKMDKARGTKARETFALAASLKHLGVATRTSNAAGAAWSQVENLDIVDPEGWQAVQELYKESFTGSSWNFKIALMQEMTRAASLMNEGQLRKVFETIQNAWANTHSSWYRELATAPKATVQLLLDILDTCQSKTIWALVAEHPKAADEAVVARLAKSQNHRVVTAIAPNASGEVFAGMVDRAMKKSASHGIEIIETRADAGEHLEPMAIKPALLDPDKNIRIKAVGIAGKIKPKNKTGLGL